MTENTLPKLLKKNADKYGDRKIAMRVKDRGIWQSFTWKDYYENVKYFALGLISLGMKRGDKVSILGENKPEIFWAELGCQAAGGTMVGIFTDCTPPEVKFYVTDSDSTFVVAHDQEQVDKLLQIKDDLPLVKKVIYWDPKGLWNYDDPILTSFTEMIDLGKRYGKDHPGLIEESIKNGKGEEIALICYTSGTTGLPKGAMISHGGLVAIAQAWQDVDHWSEQDRYVSFIPPGWIAEQAVGVAGQLVSGMEVNFPEEPETVQENIREIGPSILFFAPRLWENINRMIQAKITDTSALRRWIYRLFLPVGYRAAEYRSSRKGLGLFLDILYPIAHWTLFRPLKDRVGLSQIRCAYTAGSAVSPDILNYFQAIGVNIKQLYGGSEQGLVTIHLDGQIKYETCGPPMPGVEISLSPEGEIMVKGENIFSGYYKNLEATQEKIRNGWYYTGDFGYIDEDRHLVVLDRMEDLKELRGGRKFSPQFAEIRLRFCPYIKDALVVGGEDKDLVTAIINIDLDNVSRWAEARRIPYTTFTDLSQKPEVIELIKKDIQRINKFLPEWSRIRKFVNLYREFDADEAELTRTRKLRRTFVESRYSDLITALYGKDREYHVEASVTYRDGRKGVVKTSIYINEIVETQ
ncbi:MAG: long-chain fatty acid--CoA ligase [Deltaproteobacteria bacterium]|nr:long-chain fatty acid--CoA ligase [Deltaproteobacteria bacterium]